MEKEILIRVKDGLLSRRRSTRIRTGKVSFFFFFTSARFDIDKSLTSLDLAPVSEDFPVRQGATPAGTTICSLQARLKKPPPPCPTRDHFITIFLQELEHRDNVLHHAHNDMTLLSLGTRCHWDQISVTHMLMDSRQFMLDNGLIRVQLRSQFTGRITTPIIKPDIYVDYFKKSILGVDTNHYLKIGDTVLDPACSLLTYGVVQDTLIELCIITPPKTFSFS